MRRTGEDGGGRKWYEKYLPFVAKSPRMQVDWLTAAFQRGTLTREEITPYIRLLLADGQDEHAICGLLRDLNEGVLTDMLQTADIYDTPKLFRLIPSPTLEQAGIALRKMPPPYEKAPIQVRDKIFTAIHDASEELLKKAVADLEERGEITAEFNEAYQQFNEILMDAKILSSLYPKAKL